MEHVADADAVALAEDMIGLRGPGGDVESVDGVAVEVTGAGEIGWGAVGEGEVGGEFRADRIEAAGGNNVVGEGRAGAAGGVVGGRVVDAGEGAGGVGGFREIAGALEVGGHGEVADNADALALEFDVGEEEGLVLNDGAAEQAAEHVPAQRGLVRREEAAGVEFVVAQVFVDAAGELIGPGAGGHHDDAAGGVAVLGGVGALLNADFLDRFDRGIEKGLGNFEGDVGGVDAVQKPLLLVGAAAADRNARTDDVAADVDAVAHEPEQVADTAAVEGHVGDGLVFDELADGGGFGFDE